MFNKLISFVFYCLLLGLVSESAMAQNENKQQNIKPLELQELWRITDDDHNPFLIGTIVSAAFDDYNNVYLLDSQLAEVKVFDAQGDYFGTLSRAGEGPGETRNPFNVLCLPDDKIGIVQTMPGKMVIIDDQGEPVVETPFLYSKNGQNFFKSAYRASYTSGSLVLWGATKDGINVSDSIARHSMNGFELYRFVEYKYNITELFSEYDLQTHFYDIYAVDELGNVYIAAHWDQYLIDVYNSNNQLVRTIRRDDYQSYERSPDQKQQIIDTHLMTPPGIEVQKKVMDTERDVVGLHIDYHGNLWVRNSRSTLGQPSGVMLSYDIFSPNGKFLGQVPIYGVDDPSRDKFYFFGADRVLVIKNLLVNSWIGPDDGGPQMQCFICYQLVVK